MTWIVNMDGKGSLSRAIETGDLVAGSGYLGRVVWQRYICSLAGCWIASKNLFNKSRFLFLFYWSFIVLFLPGAMDGDDAFRPLDTKLPLVRWLTTLSLLLLTISEIPLRSPACRCKKGRIDPYTAAYSVPLGAHSITLFEAYSTHRCSLPLDKTMLAWMVSTTDGHSQNAKWWLDRRVHHQYQSLQPFETASRNCHSTFLRRGRLRWVTSTCYFGHR